MVIRFLLNTAILLLFALGCYLLHILIVGSFFVVVGGKGYTIDAPDQIRLFALLSIFTVFAFVRLLWLVRRRVNR
jgi:hypothetical protein